MKTKDDILFGCMGVIVSYCCIICIVVSNCMKMDLASTIVMQMLYYLLNIRNVNVDERIVGWFRMVVTINNYDHINIVERSTLSL
jgi:mannitol-specific phosphotransferase system IIBC component